MRKLWTQGEVVQMGKFLGFKRWDRRDIRYWIDQGLFPEPVAQAKGIIAFYPDDKLELAFVDISRRMRDYVKVTDEDVKMAKKLVLEQVRSKNISTLIDYVKKN